METSQQQLINKKLESKYEEIFEDLKKDTYRNGNAKSEIFARFCEYYLLDKEKLNITLQEVEPFDELCIIVYMEHKELIN